jgi:putative tryptophan/tyrosine transport system substrate-binding protein
MRTAGSVATLALLVLCTPGCDRRASNAVPNIGVVTIIDHPLLEQARRGFVETLAAAGYREGNGVRYDYRNAYGKLENANAIAAAFVGNDVNLVYSISTPATQAIKAHIHDIPVVFAAVTDPVAAGIVSSDAHPGSNVTGVSDRMPIKRLFATLKELLPSATRLGLPYNAGEANSAAQVAEMRRLAPEFGLTLVEATAANTADVSQAVSGLVGKVDVVYMLADNTMASAVSVIADICQRNRIPFVSCEDAMVKENKALAALVVDHYELGRIAAGMAIRILRGEAQPDQIPVAQLADFALILNLTVARELGVDPPSAAVAKATIIP